MIISALKLLILRPQKSGKTGFISQKQHFFAEFFISENNFIKLSF
jgi:hypothetical protein